MSNSKKKSSETGCHLIIPIHVDTHLPHLPDGKYETAISFSKAEHILVASWSPVQQFVYHVLRVFLNDLFGEATFPVTGNYDLKTFMLWMCEEIPLEDVMKLLNYGDWLDRTNYCKQEYRSNQLKQRRNCRHFSEKEEKNTELILPDQKKRNFKLAGFKPKRRTNFKGPH